MAKTTRAFAFAADGWHWTLDEGGNFESSCLMATPIEENFNDYKKAEKKALELLAEMKATSPKKTDIELALLVAIFELHKGTLPAGTVVSIIQGHLKQLSPFYAGKTPPA